MIDYSKLTRYSHLRWTDNEYKIKILMGTTKAFSIKKNDSYTFQ